MPVTGAVSWTVLGADGDPVEPVESYPACLAALERSPNTQRAYATSLKLWFEFLERVERSWSEVDVDDVARFVSWLRAPADNPPAPADATNQAQHLARIKPSGQYALVSADEPTPDASMVARSTTGVFLCGEPCGLNGACRMGCSQRAWRTTPPPYSTSNARRTTAKHRTTRMSHGPLES